MNLRYVALAAGAACALAGCANDAGQPSVFGYSAGSPLVTSAMAGQTPPTDEQLAQKTLAGKVLTAIALERVTGRKPDPARFSELY